MADYYVDVVNNRDEVVGKDLKGQKLIKGFISRVVAVFLRDSGGKFLICKRASHKEDAANLWDLAVCGNVESGESYDTAARRELEEELGIFCALQPLDKFYEEVEATKGGTLKVFCGVFCGLTDEMPQLNHELSEFRKMNISEIESELAENPKKFCHGFRNDFERVKEKLKALPS